MSNKNMLFFANGINYSLDEKVLDSIQNLQISSIGIFVGVIFSILLSYLIRFTYIKYGMSISNKKNFADIFAPLTITTYFIITVVKSSLALSLGLVGALSIVRFRAAIKEPEELIYLFMCIAIGLGLGADQLLPTIVITLSISTFIFLRQKLIRKNNNQFFSLLISYPKSSNDEFDKVIDVIQKYSFKINLQRYSDDNENIEASLLLNIYNFEEMRKLQKLLSNKFPSLRFDFVDNESF